LGKEPCATQTDPLLISKIQVENFELTCYDESGIIYQTSISLFVSTFVSILVLYFQPVNPMELNVLDFIDMHKFKDVILCFMTVLYSFAPIGAYPPPGRPLKRV
jgi:hypothetical protein